MKKVIIIFGLLLIILPTSLFIYMYQATMNSKDHGMVSAEKRIHSYIENMEIESKNVYFGDEKYFVFQCKNKNNEQAIFFVPESKDKEVVIKNVRQGLTKDEVRSYIEKTYQPKEIISLKLGIRKDVPLWEATYVVSDGSYVYEYLDFESGKLLQKYTLKK